MLRVWNQVPPGHAAKELVDVLNLQGAWGCQVRLPTRHESPGVLVPIKLSRTAAEHSPVCLFPQHMRSSRTWKRSGVVFVLVIRFDEVRRGRGRAEISLENDIVGFKISVGGIQSHQGSQSGVLVGIAAVVV